MKLEKWALIAEIIGGVAVVFSLIYVGFQVAQNTQAIRINTVQQSLSWILNESEHILLYEDLRETMRVDDLTSLSAMRSMAPSTPPSICRHSSRVPSTA